MRLHPLRATVLARLALLLAVFSLTNPSAQAAASKTSNDDLARYADQLFSQTYPANEPGAAVLVMKDGQVVLRKGYGMAHLELGVPIQPDQVFGIGSITKQFTATAILMLQERGKLSVDDEVTKYLPDYPTHGQKITIDHLLTHVSGIPSYTGLIEWRPQARKDMTVQQVIDLFKDKPLEFNPGEKWAYNNSAYILLGAVIEKVSGKSYEDFIEQEIFAPLGMKSSRYGHQREVIPGRVAGYDQTADGGYQIAEYLSMTQPYAAGSLMSTVDDLALWAEALAGGKVLKKESLERMTTPAKLESGMSTKYAYGLGVSEGDGARIVEHGGAIFGFVSHLLHVPGQRLVIVVLSNIPPQEPGPGSLAYRVALKSLGRPWEERKAVQLDPSTLDEYAGVYRFDETTIRAIFHKGDKLIAQRRGGERHEILAASRDEFFYEDSDSRIHFRRDAQGKITGMDFLQRLGPDEIGAKTDEPFLAERQAIQVDPGLYDAYVGVYELAPGFHLTLTREGDRLIGQPTGLPKAELFPESETKFFLQGEDVQVEFQRGPDGKATGLTLFQGGRQTPGKRVK